MRFKNIVEQPAVTKEDIIKVIDDVLHDIEQGQEDIRMLKNRMQASEEKLLDLFNSLEG